MVHKALEAAQALEQEGISVQVVDMYSIKPIDADLICRTAAETELNDTNSKLWEEYQLTESEARSQCVPFESLTELRRSVTEVRGKIRALGNVNVGAIDEYKEVRERYEFMKAQVTDVEKAKAELTKMIAELCSEMQELFTASFKQINANFQQIFKSSRTCPRFPAASRRWSLSRSISPSCASTPRRSASSMRSRPRWTT